MTLYCFAKLAESYGIQIFSYADPCAGVTILGPKRLKILTSTFMFPLLKQLDAHLNSQDVVVLCPKTALALIASELAGWKEHPLPQMLPAHALPYMADENDHLADHSQTQSKPL